MIRSVSNIIEKNYMKVSILDCVRKIQDICYNQDIECFTAFEDERLVGVLTKKDLLNSHPNRIVADVMTTNYKRVTPATPIWEIEELLHQTKNLDVIIIEEKNEVIGIITSTALNIELGKHIDLLTGLYKSDYLFYNAYNLIKNSQRATVVFIDLDQFGSIDKKYGHIIGDNILKNVSKVLKDNIDKDSFLCRYAGDEFAILTPYSLEDSNLLAEKIIDALKASEFPNGIPVSASIGITSCKLKNKSESNLSSIINELVNIASLASTKAKGNDSNAIFIEKTDIGEIA